MAKEEKIAIVNDIVGRVETTRFTHEQGVKELMKKLGMSKESAEAVLDTYRYLPLPKDEPSGGSGDDKGGISQEQQEEAKKKLEELAVPMMEVEYTHAEYNKLFRRGEIKTPIKTVKMGVDQFSKLGSRDGGNRKSYIGAAYQTLTDPVVVIKEGNDDVYIKSFIGENGISTFISVEKDKEDGRFVVTNYKRKKDEILKKIKKADGIVYLKDDSGSPARMDKEGVPHASGSHTSTVSPESGEKSSDSGKKTKIIDKNGKLKPGIRMTGAEWQENGYFKYYHNGYSRDMIDDRYYTSDYRNELTETWEDFNARDKRTDGTESGSGEVSAKTGKLFNEVVKIAYGGKMPTFGEMDPTRRIYENADIGEITGLLVRGKFVALRPGLNDNVVYIDENEDERTTNYNLLDDASQKKLQGALKEHINKMLGLKKSIMAALEFFRNRMAKETEKSLTWSGHELQGRTKIHGMDISIENKKGSTRSGTDKDGHEWNVKMNFAYGYIRGAVGKDKDFLDCYIGPDPESDRVFIVHQNDPVTGSYDEDKVMLGFENKEAAEKAYLSQYDRPGFLGDIVEMGIEEFKDTIFDENNKGKRIEKALFTENELRNNARFAREVCKFFKDEEG
ncbi:MAG: hypothetical protein LBQ88_19130, partial [Treponema sp.]|nr:hypothetical protein [Treponema sp.]